MHLFSRDNRLLQQIKYHNCYRTAKLVDNSNTMSSWETPLITISHYIKTAALGCIIYVHILVNAYLHHNSTYLMHIYKNSYTTAHFQQIQIVNSVRKCPAVFIQTHWIDKYSQQYNDKSHGIYWMLRNKNASTLLSSCTLWLIFSCNYKTCHIWH